jgi:Mrp family chromosome partitioning ATPase
MVCRVKKARPFSIDARHARRRSTLDRCGGVSIGTTQALAMTRAASPNRARVTCVVNQKGGVGKTTTAVNLAASVAAAEKRTLLVDMDPQGNASSGCGVRSGTRERTIYDVLIGAVRMDEVLDET